MDKEPVDLELEALNSELKEMVDVWKTEFDTRGEEADYQYQMTLLEKLKKAIEGDGLDLEVVAFKTDGNKGEMNKYLGKDFLGGDRYQFKALDWDATEGRCYPSVSMSPQRGGLCLYASRLTPLILTPNEVESLKFIKP